MDYLAFGLLAGSLIVIASFVVRDGLPHLSAIRKDSRLDRLSRAAAPRAWGRWCADAGLVLAGAGTAVLLITVVMLLAGVSDGAGNMLVGLSIAGAVVASTLGLARLAQRLGRETDAELRGELWPDEWPAGIENVVARPSAVVARPEPAGVIAGPGPATTGPHATDVLPPPAHEVRTSADVPDVDIRDDELPRWLPSPGGEEEGAPGPTGARLATTVDAPFEHLPLENAPEPASRARPVPPWRERLSGRRRGAGTGAAPRTSEADESLAPVAPPNPAPGARGELEPVIVGGAFSSPLLADIGMSSLDRDGEEGFRSPLLSDLVATPYADDAPGGGSDLLIDEGPAPVQPAGRHRDEADNR